MAKQKITASDVRVLLHQKFEDHRQYAYAEEVGNATGSEQKRRLDAVVVNVYRSSGYSIEGIEIKVSRADLRRELEDASKHNIFYDSLDYYSLAAPADIIDTDIIPKKWGIYAVYENDGAMTMKTMRKPLALHDEKQPDINRPFFACLMRALCNQMPTATAIEAAYKEGEAAAEKKLYAEISNSDKAQIDKLHEDLRAYEELSKRLRMWGKGSIERGIEKYEALTTLDLVWLDSSLKNVMDRIKEVRKAIPEAQRSKY